MFKELNGRRLCKPLGAYPTHKFIEHEDGAVATDWVVLAALVVGICAAVMLSIGGGVTQASASLSEAIVATDPGETGAVAGQAAGSSQDDSGNQSRENNGNG
jgi:Flp pilus assembly pilin Flp